MSKEKIIPFREIGSSNWTSLSSILSRDAHEGRLSFQQYENILSTCRQLTRKEVQRHGKEETHLCKLVLSSDVKRVVRTLCGTACT